MVIAIVLAGGTGTRMGDDVPKQYISVEGKPIISYSMETFEKHDQVDGFVVVAVDEWRALIDECIEREGIRKFMGYADAGESRQHSVYNGLKKTCTITDSDTDVVLVHDAARPCVSEEIITDCIAALEDAEAVIPVTAIKDTVYCSKDGEYVWGTVKREELFAGQTPECFRLKKYLAIHDSMPYEQIGYATGACQIAFNNGMEIKFVKGSEGNYKITTMADLERFRYQMKKMNCEGVIEETLV